MRSILAISLLAAALTAASASPRPSAAEPAAGVLATGKSMLVDDGTCPPGQIKMITGGDIKRGMARVRTCVRRR